MRPIAKSTMAAVAGLGALTLLAGPAAASLDARTDASPPVRLAHMGADTGGRHGEGMGATGLPRPGGDCSARAGMTGQGMMGQGRGMMGQGRGMMGQGRGMMGQGMMGPGMGQGMMGPGAGHGMRVVPTKDLSTDDVRHFLEQRLAWHDNKRLKVGEVKQADDDTITAEIVTVDGSLVQRFKVDRHNGWLQRTE